jgi:hypothetical protein
VRSDSLTDPGEIGTMGLGRALYALPRWTFDVFVGHVDDACAVGWWLAAAALGFLGARGSLPQEGARTGRPLARIDPSLVPLVCVLAVYLVTPFRVGAGGMLNVRLAPIVAMSAEEPAERAP